MSKSSLNTLATIFGVVAGAANFLGGIGVINHSVASTIGGFATIMLGYLVQRPATGEQPQALQK